MNKKPKSEKWYAAMAAKRGTTAKNQFTKAVDLGLAKPTVSEETKEKLKKSAIDRKHTEETKNKISKARKIFLEQNPDMVPYKLNHYSNGRSYPEEYWKVVLDSNNLNYVEQYPIGLYQLDFAFVEEKIDLEIDGSQHYCDIRIIESDKRRTQFLENLGWKVIRVNWSEYKKLVDKKTFVEYILNELTMRQ